MGAHEFCKSVRKLLGVETGWDWLSPDQPIQLTHTLKSDRRDGGPRAVPANRERLLRGAESFGT